MEQKDKKTWTKYVSNALLECAKLLQSSKVKYGAVIAVALSTIAYVIESL